MLKTDIRKEFKSKRESLSIDERVDMSKRIAENAVANFDLKNKVVSIFLPIERLNEVQTTFLIDHLKALNCNISTPVSDFNSLQLKHVVYTDKTILKNNDWGIPEPIEGEEIQPEDLQFVFVPLLVTDKSGFRVGYGKGFYDRFLSQCSKDAVFIGLNYFNEIVEVEDLSKDDVPLHYLVTPQNVLKF